MQLDADRGWHSKDGKPQRKQELLGRIKAKIASPPIQAHGPAAMHAVFYREPASRKNVVCLVNEFGWFRSEREPPKTSHAQSPPAPCSNVVIEVSASGATITQAFDAVTGKPLVVHRQNGQTKIVVPPFPVMACIVIE